MFPLSFVATERPGRRSCDHCGLLPTCTNPPITCLRCGTFFCRRCYSRSCVVHVGSTIVALPVIARAKAVCDACYPEDVEEAKFTEACLPFMVRGEAFDRNKPALFGGPPTVEMCWVALDTTKRRLSWRSMELVNQQPKSSGEVSLDEIDHVEVTSGGANANGSSGRAGGGSEGSGGGHMKFFNARNQLLLWVACDDPRQHARWSQGLTQARALLRFPQQRVFPSQAAVRASLHSQEVAEMKADEAERAKEARVAAMERRAKDRAAYRASLGDVGMRETAKVMAGQGQKRVSHAVKASDDFPEMEEEEHFTSDSTALIKGGVPTSSSGSTGGGVGAPASLFKSALSALGSFTTPPPHGGEVGSPPTTTTAAPAPGGSGRGESSQGGWHLRRSSVTSTGNTASGTGTSGSSGSSGSGGGASGGGGTAALTAIRDGFFKFGRTVASAAAQVPSGAARTAAAVSSQLRPATTTST